MYECMNWVPRTRIIRMYWVPSDCHPASAYDVGSQYNGENNVRHWEPNHTQVRHSQKSALLLSGVENFEFCNLFRHRKSI